MIVTTDHCQLVCVEAEHIRRIYDNHKSTMKDLLNVPGRPISLGEESCDGVEPGGEVEVFPETGLELSAPVVSVVLLVFSYVYLFLRWLHQNLISLWLV